MPHDKNKNQFVRTGSVPDLAGGATLAQVITKVNEILAALRKAGTISS